MRKVFAAVATTVAATALMVLPVTAATAAGSPGKSISHSIVVKGGGASIACGGCTVGF